MEEAGPDPTCRSTGQLVDRLRTSVDGTRVPRRHQPLERAVRPRNLYALSLSVDVRALPKPPRHLPQPHGPAGLPPARLWDRVAPANAQETHECYSQPPHHWL